MNKKIIATMVALVCCLSLSAQDSLKITFLNPSPVVIGGKEYRKGDLFLSSEKPVLLPNQVMKVFDTATGKVKVITDALLAKSGNKTVWAYLTDNKRLSSRDPFNRTFGLFERISLKGELPVDSVNYYFVSYEHNGEQINKRLPTDSTNIVLDHSIFTIDGNTQTPFDTKLKLSYYNAETKKGKVLSNKLILNVSEADTCRKFIFAYLYTGLDKESIRELVVEYLDISCPEIEFQENDIELFINKLTK
jgi:hypothetical protein